MKIRKFKDIKEIYNINSVENEYLLYKCENKMYKKYIYEVIPVTLLDFSVEVQNSVYMLYNEFLREMNIDLQIYISNKKMNIDSYIEELRTKILNQKNENFKNFLGNYLNDLKEKLKNENIYITRYYIIITMDLKNNDEIKDIDNIILKLNKLGCVVSRIKEHDKMLNILYESINKVSLYSDK